MSINNKTKKILSPLSIIYYNLKFFFFSSANNTFKVSKSSILFGMKFKVRGKENLIQIGQYNSVKNLYIEIQGSDNKVKLGNGVKFYEGDIF